MRLPLSITQVAPGTYRVGVPIGRRVAEFELRVEEHGGIDLVVWDDDFQRLADANLGQTEPVLACVQAFHRAQRSEFREPE